MDYEELLSRAEEKMTRDLDQTDRYERVEPEVANQGNSTFLNNFSDIAKSYRREPDHLFKYLLKELGVPGEIQKNRALFQGKFTEKQIEKKLKKYEKNYVMCPACGKPDTKFISESGVTKMKCEACTEKRTVSEI